ncbi:MAG TPA: urea ABC transporter ATP-binding subunit UrtE [Steroidobacteraceae bacterium]|nr:urea ABC transporter ATP-binding subunit UrtE [Steroidobacteraceae bacterium]
MTLALSNIEQFYGESHTLWDVSFSLEPGRCTCLMGRNGVGKTTLLKTVMGLVPAASGSARFDGIELLGKSTPRRAELGIGYVPQGREIFPQLTVEENLKLGLPARRDRVRTIPEKIYELFPVLKDMRQRRGGDLSGGQQQQLAIGRALVLDPKLLVLDEPAEGIQPNIVAEIGHLITRLCKEFRMTVLLVEQKLPFVRKFGDSFVILDKGRVVANGPLRELSDALVARHLVV